MPRFTIRPYGGADEAGLLEVWNAALPMDPVDQQTFRRKVILDPNLMDRERGAIERMIAIRRE